ncbi:MAG: hypothetical protein WD557_16275 [Dehalococcoidia bacterium]
MFGRAVFGALLLLSCAAAWSPNSVRAQDPADASRSESDCAAGATDCARPGDERVVPSRPSELVDGRENQSNAILVGLMLVAFAGLVVSVLNRLALDED